MMGEIGRWALIFALLIVVYAGVAHLIAIKSGNKRLLHSAKNAVLVVTGLTTIASSALIYLLVTDDFRYQYVAQYTSTDTSLLYKVAAFWGGNAGSLLFWLWILTIYTALVTWSKHKDSHQYLPWVSTVMLTISLFFVFLVNFVAQPFALANEVVTEGSGLNPLLQNPGMAVHPVMLYLGYIGFTIPFAYGIAALILKKADATWLKVTRRWTLVTWLFLSMGIIYGAQWAYVELGWGGYWTWDPVENASFLPWLTGTAFLHSAMIQEKKGKLKGWNISLIVLTFMLVIFGTFLTRSGLLWSVHAFANGPIGAYFLGLIGVVLIVSLSLIWSRWSLLKADQVQYEAVVSKENSFLINNLLLVGIMFTTFFGTIYPIISETLTGTKVMVGAPYFNRVNVPIFIALILLMGICPLIAWKKSSLRTVRKNLFLPLIVALLTAFVLFAMGVSEWRVFLSLTVAAFVLATIFLEFALAVQARVKSTGENPFLSLYMLFVKNRRRYGGYIVHFAIIMIVIGLTGAGFYSLDLQSSIAPGETMRAGNYTLQYRNIDEVTTPARNTVYAEFLVSKGDKLLGAVRPKKVFYTNGNQPSTDVSVVSSFTDDLYVVLNGWIEDSEKAVIQVKVFPLISWAWFGGYVLIFGSLISLWPGKKKRRSFRTPKAMESVLDG